MDYSLSPSQDSTPLLTALHESAHRDHAPFYTPGHKRGQGSGAALVKCLGQQALQLDLPELVELDNLFAPQGVIQEAQALAAQTFGADRTWFLVNGSTGGLIAAILATCRPGDRILLPRNVHQSVISGLILSGANPVFLTPDYDPDRDLVHPVSPETVATALAQYPDTKAVLIVSPTYYGVAPDVAAIADLTHERGIPLIVDEAHGPHFAFHPELPMSALEAGADLVVQSTHKVLSALTQAAMLHLQGKRASADRVSRALQLVQSTSPSYLLLASLDAARQQMALEGPMLMARTLQRADQARAKLRQIPGLSVLESTDAGQLAGFHALDRTRLTVTVSGLGLDGFAADQILNQQYGVVAELPSLHHLTFIISLGNTPADLDRLVAGLQALANDSPIAPNSGQSNLKIATPDQWSDPTPTVSPREAFFAPAETVPIAEAVHRLSAELICPYPPGIPVLLPGERITVAAIEMLQQVQTAGGFITGSTDPTLETLRVLT